MMTTTFEKALHIDDPWTILSTNFDLENKRLDIYIDFKPGEKFYYQDEENGIEGSFPVHDTKDKKWRHLNFFEYECILHCRTPRVKLDNGKVKLVLPPWAGRVHGLTLLFEAMILQMCELMPVNSVKKLVKVDDRKIWRLLEKYVDEARKNEDYSNLTEIGIDETSRAKGHEYITLFVDMEDGRTVYITEGKGSDTIKRFVEDMGKHHCTPEQITEVSCDMSPAFIKGIGEQLENANITFDKFHIIKIINGAVDEVRRQEVKEVDALKGNRWIFLKNEKNLTDKQKEILDKLRLSKQNIKTIRALQIREAFQEIYQAESLAVFEALLKKWYWWASHSRLEPMKAAARTIKNHWDGIVNWIKSGLNNGILEGLNSLIQSAKSKARGYRSAKNLKIIAYLITGKLDFQKINPVYQPL